MDNANLLEQVNERLKRGEGWVGDRYSKGSNGDRVPSKFLYYAFYHGSQQKFVNSKTNDPEEAYLMRGELRAKAFGFCRPRFRESATKT
jgi:ribosomal protein S14